MIDNVLFLYAAAYLIFWGAKMETSAGNLLYSIVLYLIFKAAAVTVGIMLAFKVYVSMMGYAV